VIQGVEALMVLIAAVLAGIDTGQGKSYQLSSGIAITIIGVVMAALLGLVAAGLRRPRRWTRTPALLTQLFVGIVGIYLLQGGRYDWGVPAVVLALAGFVVLFAPPSTRALTVGLPQPPARRQR
jgi:peptidoglycan/LPS O-acetylase OafA/YrhL